MKVLHYTPRLDDAGDVLTQLVHLSDEMPVNTHYITTLWATRSSATPRNMTVYQMLSKPCKHVNLIHLQNRFLQVLYATMPDVVHIHGCWSYISAKIGLWAKNRNFKVVVSPHRQLDQGVFDDRFWSKRLPQILYYQKRAIKRVDALWAEDEKEAKRLRRLGWNKRIFVADMDDDPGTQAAVFASFYQQVADTACYAQMHEHEKAAYCALLHTGLADAEETHLLDAQSILNLRGLSATSWRRILILADDQHVTPTLLNGIGRMQLAVPHIDASKIRRFSRRIETSALSLSDTELIHASKRKEKRAAAIRDEETRRHYVMLENLRQLLKDKRLCTLQLTDYYQYVRHAQVDELQLRQSLRTLGIYHFAGRLQQILYESLYLEHGFMPLPPVDDHGTERIRKTINQIYR